MLMWLRGCMAGVSSVDPVDSTLDADMATELAGALMDWADRLAKIYYMGKNCWTSRDKQLGKELLDWLSRLEELLLISLVSLVVTEPADPPSPSKVQEIPPKEATRKAPEASGKHPIESPTGYLDFGRQPENRAGGGNSTTKVAEQDSRDCVRAMGATGGNSRTMENELLQLTRAMDALRVDLPKWAIEDYKKLLGFEMGLVRMGWVSLEFGYQLALARLRA
ncbi:hypothetical protein GW17_00032430 [Ensete ventricosum]|nr:hypothetical protein GW17_00032430 [Ensete ventricosum]